MEVEPMRIVRAVVIVMVLCLGGTVPALAGDVARTLTLERDVEPILTRFGCNAGACHGKSRGQNGFQLSLLGFDPVFDFDAISREARGRRIFPAAPDASLLLQKASAKVPHGGGRKLEPDSSAYRIVRDWIAAGTPRDLPGAPALVRIKVEPTARVLPARGEERLKVTAEFSDGTNEDVTALAAFQSSESAIAGVGSDGLIKGGMIPGEAAITARFRNLFASSTITIPLAGSVPADVYAKLPRQNVVDGPVWDKLKTLGITPSEQAVDATFLRRAHLDVIGRLPTPEETRGFLADQAPDKRARLIDRLLARPEYADHWANKWMDLLRPNPYRVSIKSVLNLDAWIRKAFRENRPYDEFVVGILTARGSTWRGGATTVWRDRRLPEESATMVSQLFLGIRLECARCHHHPFEAWAQDDFYGFAAYFARVGRKGKDLFPPIAAGEEVIFTSKEGTVLHPLTKVALQPKPLFGSAPADADPEADPREALARWLTSPDNPYFARVIANRVWAELMGRGIVEPVDDLRATNPPSNAPLLDALANDFRAHKYDLKHLIRTIATSTTYGLSSHPNPRNNADTRFFSRHYRQRLRAETLLDAVSDLTGIPERFDAAPAGTRAVALWTVRGESLFLDTFGRPDPNQDPPCERTPDTSVTQALHLMNAPNLHAKVTSDDGLPARLAGMKQSTDALTEELYLRAYTRLPIEAERKLVAELLAEAKDDPKARRQVIEDLLWAIINSPEFVFKD
jgi:hypothetical protein